MRYQTHETNCNFSNRSGQAAMKCRQPDSTKPFESANIASRAKKDSQLITAL